MWDTHGRVVHTVCCFDPSLVCTHPVYYHLSEPGPPYVELDNITNHKPPPGLHNRQQMLAGLRSLILPSHTFLVLAHVCMRNKCCSLTSVKLPTIW